MGGARERHVPVEMVWMVWMVRDCGMGWDLGGIGWGLHAYFQLKGHQRNKLILDKNELNNKFKNKNYV